MMQAGVTSHASAIAHPFRMTGILAIYVADRTNISAFSTTSTLGCINGEMLVSYKVVMEETTKETAIETRHSTLIKMLTTSALAYPF